MMLDEILFFNNLGFGRSGQGREVDKGDRLDM